MALWLSGDPEADALLEKDPFALLLATLLDQQVRLEMAYAGPHRLKERLGHLDPALIAATPEDELAEHFRTKPAVHRFPAAMARRARELAAAVADDYDGDAGAIWRTAETGEELMRRLRALPGFGTLKSAILIALLAKQLGVRPEGWEKAAGGFARDGFISVADVYDAESLAAMRQYKSRHGSPNRRGPRRRRTS